MNKLEAQKLLGKHGCVVASEGEPVADGLVQIAGGEVGDRKVGVFAESFDVLKDGAVGEAAELVMAEWVTGAMEFERRCRGESAGRRWK